MDFLFRLLVFLSNEVVNFFGPMSPDPPFYDIPPVNRSRDARPWWKAITEGIRPTQDRDNPTISKVQWFKDIGGLGHESQQEAYLHS